MTALVETRLGELAAGANREHLACEAAYGTAIEHAFRAGEHLLAAKAEVAHGDWMTWVEENFVGADRTARAYMQLAGEPNRQRVADSSVREALSTLAVPRERDPEPVDAEVVDAEPAEEGSGRSVLDMLREEGGLEEADDELRQEDARREEMAWPRTGVERATLRQIRDAKAGAERSLEQALRRDVSDWTRAEALGRASKAFREASELADGLATMLRSAL
jgi:hypothetical protein